MAEYRRLSKDKAVVLMVDHQAGLVSLVQDFSPGEFKNNILALADLAKYFKLPTILSTSFEEGPNGPILPEIREIFPEEKKRDRFIFARLKINLSPLCLFLNVPSPPGTCRIRFRAVIPDAPSEDGRSGPFR